MILSNWAIPRHEAALVQEFIECAGLLDALGLRVDVLGFWPFGFKAPAHFLALNAFRGLEENGRALGGADVVAWREGEDMNQPGQDESGWFKCERAARTGRQCLSGRTPMSMRIGRQLRAASGLRFYSQSRQGQSAISPAHRDGLMSPKPLPAGRRKQRHFRRRTGSWVILQRYQPYGLWNSCQFMKSLSKLWLGVLGPGG